MLRKRQPSFTLRPPADSLKLPLFRPGEIPRAAPDGTAIDPREPAPEAVETLAPPDLKRGTEPPAIGAHWHRDDAGWGWHHDKLWGRWDGKSWVWLQREANRWWLNLLGSASSRDSSAHAQLVRHGGRWWWKKDGVWFVLHDGEPWGYRYFSAWKQQGFINPRSGVQMMYSPDASRVLVVVPGEDGVIFDADDGNRLGSIDRQNLPGAGRAKPPSSLPPPR